MRIVLTGAATGIGAETALILSGQGHEVVAFDVARPANVDRWIEVDLSDMAAIERAVASLDGTFDVLINNAGLPPRPGNQALLLAVNVFGLRAMTREMLPKLADGARHRPDTGLQPLEGGGDRLYQGFDQGIGCARYARQFGQPGPGCHRHSG